MAKAKAKAKPAKRKRKHLKQPIADWVITKADAAEARSAGKSSFEVKQPKANGHMNGHATAISTRPRLKTPIETKTRKPRAEKWKGDRKTGMMIAAYKPSYPAIVAQMVLNGALERDLINALKTNQRVFRAWQLEHPEFAAALTISKEASLADASVMRQMYEMAHGYDQEAVKIIHVGDGEVKKVPYVERVRKDFNAARFWLVNRDPASWGRDTEQGSRDGGALPSGIQINMIEGMTLEQLKNTQTLVKAMMTPQQSLQRLDNVVDAEEVKPETPSQDLASKLTSTPKEEDNAA